MKSYADTVGIDSQARDQVHKASKHIQRTDAASVVTAGAGTYTAAQVLGGIIVRDPTGGARTDTFPTAALLIAAMKEEEVGDTLLCHIINNADQDEAITIAAGDGGTLVNVAGNDTIPQNAARTAIVRITGAASYDLYLV
jgi:hypothetical protein